MTQTTTLITGTHALLPGGWARDVALDVGPDGSIAAVRTGVEGAAPRILLPAPSNLHSHTFQRAMAGMTEARAPERDSFWTWRVLMYRFLDLLSPEQIGAIAAMAFVEMQEAGFAAVAEFHYLHHQPGGAPYEDIAETSRRIFAAARDTGIGLTHLPVLYSHGGPGAQPLEGGQKRFGNDMERFSRLMMALDLEGMPGDTRIGVAPHSLRAVTTDVFAHLSSPGPIHIHAAEQEREVEEIEAWLGARPVQWLLDNAGLSERWCLIHCTQMQPGETEALARSGAVAGLCPVTEANLGDGIFDGPRFLGAGGRFGVGSDSNIRVSLAQELRALEYSQRLRDRARNVLAPEGGGSVGENLFLRAASGAARALDREAGALAPGLLADVMALDAGALTFAGLTPQQFVDGWIFAGADGPVADLWSAGRHRVVAGRHVARTEVEANYRAAISALTGAL
ncbi:formimidoylglutamate deiminase [Oceanicella sp. SM1341]|uniref:formimidoylglutamate deiminase n=1 Tax=Oceanicella sp. SM1341 TaxID=1548889 RepID=UPI000E531FEC|nr:formimidoylglutamate deiminase [Oceanicella sp. SM1341]